MAELATIARPYAEALFKASGSDLAQAQAWLEPLAAVAADPQLLAFAASPSSSTAQVLEVAQAALKQPLPAAGKNFLSEVVANGRLSALPEMAAQFRSLKNAQAGVSDAVVHSAFAMDASALADVSAALEKRFGKKLNLSVVHAPELIGGVRVVVGDEVLDTSVKARLDQMKAALVA
jgi:F-type H+-transporting ATPase subunit delta